MNDIEKGAIRVMKRSDLADYLIWMGRIYGDPSLDLQFLPTGDETTVKLVFNKDYKPKPPGTNDTILKQVSW